MAGRDEFVSVLAQFSLFADLSSVQLEAVVGELDEVWFADRARILRQGLSGAGLYFIIDGSCAIEVGGQERARLDRGDFFGEVSVLLECAPSADVVALGAVRCLVLPGPEVRRFLAAYPSLMYRMLQTQARRLRAANAWRS